VTFLNPFHIQKAAMALLHWTQIQPGEIQVRGLVKAVLVPYL
jgi:hypothetical protein